jgi:hypothetical protein
MLLEGTATTTTTEMGERQRSAHEGRFDNLEQRRQASAVSDDRVCRQPV